VNFETGKRTIVNTTIFTDNEIFTRCPVGMTVTAEAVFGAEDRSIWHGFPVKTPVPISGMELVFLYSYKRNFTHVRVPL
jgi:hypothetical protein